MRLSAHAIFTDNNKEWKENSISIWQVSRVDQNFIINHIKWFHLKWPTWKAAAAFSQCIPAPPYLLLPKNFSLEVWLAKCFRVGEGSFNSQNIQKKHSRNVGSSKELELLQLGIFQEEEVAFHSTSITWRIPCQKVSIRQLLTGVSSARDWTWREHAQTSTAKQTQKGFGFQKASGNFISQRKPAYPNVQYAKTSQLMWTTWDCT